MGIGYAIEDEKWVVRPEGELSAERGVELKAALLQAIKGAQGVVLDLGRVSSMDLPALQIMCSAHKSAVRAGREFAVRGGDREAFDSLVERAGYLRHKGCTRENEKTCLWVPAKKGRRAPQGG